jgi:hypothetical protein
MTRSGGDAFAERIWRNIRCVNAAVDTPPPWWIIVSHTVVISD